MIHGVVDDFLAAIGTVPPGARFLDVGCGSGNVLLEMARRFSPKQVTFIGVDPSPEMIAIAQDNSERDSCASHVSFLCGTSSDPDTMSRLKEMDYLVIRNTISWMDHVDEEMRMWLDCLKPRGTVLIRELRRDAHFLLLKTRIRNCLAFHAHEFTLAYPPSAMVAAYRSALTPAELVTILNRCDISITIKRPGEHDDVTTEPWGVDMFFVGEKRK
jgi:ubiquinone/menaquinone biosynthesis C-methylase UbiE